MIARRDIGELQVAAYVRAVLIEHLQKRCERLFAQLGGAAQDFKDGQQVHRAQGDLHRASPISPAPQRILLAPTCNLRDDTLSEPFFISDGVGARQRDEVCEGCTKAGRSLSKVVEGCAFTSLFARSAAAPYSFKCKRAGIHLTAQRSSQLKDEG